MTMMLVMTLAGICGGLLLWGVLQPGRIYEFPFLTGATMAGWVLPQLVGLTHNVFLPPGALSKTVFMTILCAGACFFGYIWQSRRRFVFDFNLDEDKLLHVAIILTAFGGFFYIALSRLPEEQLELTQFTGASVAYLFFADVLSYGFAIALLLYCRRGSRVALALALFASSFYLERIVFAGRRGDVVQLVLMLMLALWFQRSRLVPISVMLVALIGGSLVFNSIDQYRAIALSKENRDWSRLANIDFVQNLESLTREGGEEMTDAVYKIAATDAEQNFDFGLFNWNMLIFNYVPAQLVGQNLKSLLMVDLPDDASNRFGYSGNVGATATGMSDAFSSFWYFGAMKFFLIAFLMAIVYRSAVAGNITAQICYMVILPDSLHAITHHTQWFFSPWVHMCIFLLPALLYARSSGSRLRPVAIRR